MPESDETFAPIEKVLEFVKSLEADVPYAGVRIAIDYRDLTGDAPSWPLHAEADHPEIVSRYVQLRGCHYFVYGFEVARELAHKYTGYVPAQYSAQKIYDACVQVLQTASAGGTLS